MMFSTATIDRGSATDLPAIFALLDQSGLPEAGLADHLPNVLVARDGEEIVGSAALELYATCALLRSVAVDRRWRGRGLGQRLVHAAIDLARQHGVAEVYLLTETAANFFPRFGFELIERTAVTLPIQQSIEFTSACPSSAQTMRRTLV